MNTQTTQEIETPTKQKTAAVYIRESTEEQGKGFSPENQKRAIEEFATKNGFGIYENYTDYISGTSAMKRDNFQKMIGNAMQNKFDVILVFHTSRFARNVEEAKQYKNLLRKKLGINVISVTQSFGNYEDPSSYLNESINEVFDEHYSRQLSFWVRSGLMEKRRQGRPIGGCPPYGYTRKKTGYDEGKQRIVYSKNWDIDEDQARIVRRFFKMYASGDYSMEKIATILSREGHKTRYGNPFTYSSLKCMLANKTYIGLVHSPRKDLPDLPSIVHKPIISKELFNSCQAMIKARRHTCGRPVAQHRFYLLQGLLCCQHCSERLAANPPTEKQIRPMQSSMYCETHKWTGGHRLFYACKFKRENDSCTQPIVHCDILDKQVIDYMSGFNLPDEIIAMTTEKLANLFEGLRGVKKQDDRVAKLLAKKEKLKKLFVNLEEMTEDQYLLDKQKIDEELEELKQQGVMQNMTKRIEADFIRKTEKFLKDFPTFWNSEIGQVERREWIKLTLKRIWVKNSRVVAIEPREEFKALFQSHKEVIGQCPVLAPV